mmetsp:Transcript_38611/g.36959  ORF Transcript_38611/g.36959 Transcript_38611/m.36959 type:complete len:158 (-) Transcript_38611:549-1022(-)
MIEKQVLEEEEEVKFFEFLTVKPLTRSSNGQLISNALVVVYKNGNIKIHDIYGSTLIFLETNETFTGITCSPSTEDMFFALMTEKNEVWVYQMVLERRFELPGSKTKDYPAFEELPTVKKGDGPELANKRYKEMLKLYEYVIQPPIVTALDSVLSKD